MSKDKEIINKLFKVVTKQQQIITKIAQQTLGRPVPPNPNPPPTSLHPQETTKKEATVILNALPPNVKNIVKQLEVSTNGLIKVQFLPQKSSSAAFNSIQTVVTTLQNNNILPGSSYTIVEVPS